MQRRQFIALLGGTVATWPLAAVAQQSAIPTLGFLRSTRPDASTDLLAALRKGLKETGYVEGQNLTIEYRWAENQQEQLSALAADLVRQRCVVIVAGGVNAAFAAKAATATIPIIFATGVDPLRSGLVGSFNRPGGNITGVFSVSASMEGKHLGLLREVVPTAAVIGMLVNPTSPGSERQERETQAAAQALGQQLHVFKASGERDIDNVFATLTQYRIGALLIAANALFTGQRDQLVALAARHAMPVLHYTREFAEAGGLMSYGSSLTDAYRQ
ncbi:MAG: ABC transporter substrate-binding protein, partial [Pseudolabrys sp.]